MPSIAENVALWDSYDWSRGGDEWSDPWGSAKREWEITIYPRIASELRDRPRIVEIGPGMGRWTEELIPYAAQLELVDVSQKTVTGLAKRLWDKLGSKGLIHIGDGSTLPVENRSIDFVFSFDSLVHADADVLDAYLKECARVLRPGGAGFLHHANCGPRHFRGTATADSVLRGCRMAGLHCHVQELTPWVHEQDVLMDCFTSFGTVSRGPHKRVVTDLLRETRLAKHIFDLYD